MILRQLEWGWNSLNIPGLTCGLSEKDNFKNLLVEAPCVWKVGVYMFPQNKSWHSKMQKLAKEDGRLKYHENKINQ